MEINKDQEDQAKAIDHSELATPREPATITYLCFGRTQAGRLGKLYSWEKGRLQVSPDWRLLAWGC